MLTDDEIFLAIDDVPITQNYVVAVGRAIAAKVLEKLRPAEPLAVIGALERTAQLLEDQAHTLIEAHDYSCIYPEGDAKSLRDALDVFTRIGAGPAGVTPSDAPSNGEPFRSLLQEALEYLCGDSEFMQTCRDALAAGVALPQTPKEN